MTPTARRQATGRPRAREARASRQPIETWHSAAYYLHNLILEDD